ncbi:MAG: Xaa-Pro peptidase family protein [Pseudomonadota bacterium]
MVQPDYVLTPKRTISSDTNHTPAEEIIARIISLQKKLRVHDLDGCIILDKINLYYYTATMQNGTLFVPCSGEPLFFIRRSLEQGQQESPLANLYQIKKFSEIPTSIDNHKYDIKKLGVDETSLPLFLFRKLKETFPNTEFVDINRLLAHIRAIKSEYEIAQVREAGARHEQLYAAIPEMIREGMTEWDLGCQIMNKILKLGGMGIGRTVAFNSEVFGGNICFGESGCAPCAFNGPGGLAGQSPAFPLLGGDRKLKKGDIIAIDTVFGHNGYYTDKTRIFSLGAPKASALVAHDVCLNIQEKIRQMLKPGIRPCDIYEQVYETLVHPLNFEQGFMGFGTNKVEFLGHGIGLVIDELPVIAKKTASPLESNMTIAVEPKKGLERIGLVGIENTFLVTEEGGQKLTPGDDEIIIL